MKFYVNRFEINLYYKFSYVYIARVEICCYYDNATESTSEQHILTSTYLHGIIVPPKIALLFSKYLPFNIIYLLHCLSHDSRNHCPHAFYYSLDIAICTDTFFQNVLWRQWRAMTLRRSDDRCARFISCFAVVYQRINVDYHSITSLFQQWSCHSSCESAIVGYFRKFPDARFSAIRRSDWLTI